MKHIRAYTRQRQRIPGVQNYDGFSVIIIIMSGKSFSKEYINRIRDPWPKSDIILLSRTWTWNLHSAEKVSHLNLFVAWKLFSFASTCTSFVFMRISTTNSCRMGNFKIFSKKLIPKWFNSLNFKFAIVFCLQLIFK